MREMEVTGDEVYAMCDKAHKAAQKRRREQIEPLQAIARAADAEQPCVRPDIPPP
jgi:hypothetical protein